MPIEYEILPYFDWLPGALFSFGIAILVLLFVGTFFSYLAAAVRLGPFEAFYLVARMVLETVPDFAKSSPRRIWALTRLAIQESIRRRVIVVFAVFILILLFAGWYLNPGSENPARLYLTFVLTATNHLMLLLGFALSTFSLPIDIKNRTMYTITTKPVRMGEVVLGRFLGFGLVGTALLVAMACVSYVFVVRGLAHSHQMDGELRVIPGDNPGDPPKGYEGITTRDKNHRHEFRLNAEGIGRTDTQAGHWHEVRKEGDGVVIGPPQGQLEARVPLAGTLEFRDRSGRPAKTGINVGNEWTYRSYIEGDTLAAAIWTYEGVTEDKFPDGLPLEMTIRVFRSHKGNIEEGIAGTLQVINPDDQAAVRRSEKIPFTAQEFMVYNRLIPREIGAVDAQNKPLRDASGQLVKVDLFKDLVGEDGKVMIELKCTDPAQYFGVAQRDVYLHAADNSFAANFFKGYLDLWLKMMIAISFGTMFSTFLTGPVALLASLACLVVGYVAEFIKDLATGALEGGGPIEALIRLVTQKNMTVDLDLPRAAEGAIRIIDGGMLHAMNATAAMLPNYRWFDTVKFVAYGMDIEGSRVAQHLTMGFAYCFVVLLIGYFFLKSREIAA